MKYVRMVVPYGIQKIVNIVLIFQRIRRHFSIENILVGQRQITTVYPSN